MPESDRELLRLGGLARRQPLQRRIMRSVASSTAIETRQPISSIEANLLASKQVVVNRRFKGRVVVGFNHANLYALTRKRVRK